MEKVIYFEAYLAGTNHGDCQFVIKEIIEVGDELVLLPDPENKFDSTAVGVFKFKKGHAIGFLGWIQKQMNIDIFNDLMNGIEVKAVVIEKHKPDREYNFWNVRIQIYRIE
jgi:hypothetical protein